MQANIELVIARGKSARTYARVRVLGSNALCWIHLYWACVASMCLYVIRMEQEQSHGTTPKMNGQ